MNPFNFLRQSQLLYRRVFDTTEGRLVLQDLAHKCYLDHSTFDKDPITMARNEGKRLVMLDIMQTLKMNLEQLGEPPNVGQSEHDPQQPGSAPY